MAVEDIYKDLSTHMIKGVMIHEQMADYYDFLSLRGYKRCHEYHMFSEMKMLRKLHRYCLNHYNRLIEEDNFENPDIIPSSWYRYTRQDVDANTKRNAVKSGIEKWVAWESDTKKLYEKSYHELMELGEVAAANELSCFVCDVDRELKCAQRKHLDLMSADYSMEYILFDQDMLHDKYKEKMEHLYDKHGADKR